ncbi:MAG: FIST domain containing protein [Alphaproteobacteria bacterium]|nr:MAG: FIST domain containing protein [Alphaproteobacteria bacterium]
MMTSVKSAVSTCKDEQQAVRELFGQLCEEGNDPALCLFFCSPRYDLGKLKKEFSQYFADIPMVGCTTAGEITPIGYLEDSITAIAFSKDSFQIITHCIDHIGQIKLQDCIDSSAALVADLKQQIPQANGHNTFAFMLIDGLSNAEEMVTAAIGSQLGDIPLIGGSTADDWDLKETSIFYDGQFKRDMAIVILVHTDLPFQVHYTHHYVAGDAKAVITEADSVNRVVSEINGLPATQEYARLCGIDESELNISVCSNHPILMKIGGKHYSRGVVEVCHDTQSIRFACAIDKGVVCTIARPSEPTENTRRMFQQIRDEIGPVQLVLGCDCAARKMICEEQGIMEEMSEIYKENNVVGFATFGEQYHTIHMNNSFCCIAIGKETTHD